jgi:hypothetical protein
MLPQLNDKDYERIATIVRNMRVPDSAKRHFAEAIARTLLADNPKFQPTEFYRQCGLLLSKIFGFVPLYLTIG